MQKSLANVVTLAKNKKTEGQVYMVLALNLLLPILSTRKMKIQIF
jgi:hypothetical protein